MRFLARRRWRRRSLGSVIDRQSISGALRLLALLLLPPEAQPAVLPALLPSASSVSLDASLSLSSSSMSSEKQGSECDEAALRVPLVRICAVAPLARPIEVTAVVTSRTGPRRVRLEDVGGPAQRWIASSTGADAGGQDSEELPLEVELHGRGGEAGTACTAWGHPMSCCLDGCCDVPQTAAASTGTLGTASKRDWPQGTLGVMSSSFITSSSNRPRSSLSPSMGRLSMRKGSSEAEKTVLSAMPLGMKSSF
mmetsp:Transcript_50974/g.111150  ORF Transcript_50974/g.111150 Transcript_50974/m.111150 type:complete len:252 (-) Transcript_50974:31-786(-)